MWLQMTAIWAAMMVPMMLPSLVPRLHEFRPRRVALTAATAYFLVWTVCGAVVYPPTMGWPMARYAGAVFVGAGLFQFTPWKARQLDRCRASGIVSDGRSAWWHGLRMGIDCTLCCAGYTMILLVTDIMNVGVMAGVTAAITVERLAPRPALVSRALGVIFVVTGMLMVYRLAGGTIPFVRAYSSSWP
jgi:predicted metal-binding membrane protein